MCLKQYIFELCLIVFHLSFRFVSRNRLSIHNLPLNYDNDNLRDMIIAYTGFKPHECRVMRENKITPDHPKGKSKGFGFMSFNTHLEALTALRKLNNNPKVFGTQHVRFSLKFYFFFSKIITRFCIFTASYCCL